VNDNVGLRLVGDDGGAPAGIGVNAPGAQNFAHVLGKPAGTVEIA